MMELDRKMILDNYTKKFIELLKLKEQKVATAESLTGGLVSKIITGVPGSSQVFECGVCSYSNRIKHELLGVPTEILERYTEYSAETAIAMAKGIRKLSGADIGISTTGLAGPGGGTAEKPVGLVYIGISTQKRSFAQELHLAKGGMNEREQIRSDAALYAIYYALKEIEENEF